MSQDLPNLFIVGAPKCGTTAWVAYLSTHPDIFFPSRKEPHYFAEDFPGFRWIKTSEDYAALFTNAGETKFVGEASVQYLYSKVAAENIFAFNPAARILVFLRDQQSFLPSYHNQLLYNHDEIISDFAVVWQRTLDGSRISVPSTCRVPEFLNYPAVGRFDEQLRRYVDLFPPEQIMVIRFEEWTRNPRSTYTKVLGFLGLPDDGKANFELVHGAKRHKFVAMAWLTQRPPPWLLSAARLLRRMTGRERLGLAKAIRQANQSAGYQTLTPDSLKTEIEAYYVESNKRLRRLLARLNKSN